MATSRAVEAPKGFPVEMATLVVINYPLSDLGLPEQRCLMLALRVGKTSRQIGMVVTGKTIAGQYGTMTGHDPDPGDGHRKEAINLTE